MSKRVFQVVLSIIVLTFLILSLIGCIPKNHYDKVDKKLINPNASENAVKLYDFLLAHYGKNVITGQFVNEYAGYYKDMFNDENGNMSVYKAWT